MSESRAETPREPIGTRKLSRGWMVALGVILLIGGVLSILNPFLASLTVGVFAGVAFMFGGVMQIVEAVRSSDDSGSERALTGLTGVLFLLFAVFLLLNPLGGLVSLTLIVAAFFAAVGVVQIVVALRHRPANGWGWMLGSGVISILLALLILFAMPDAAFFTLGLILGIDLISSGAAYLAIGIAKRTG